MSRKQDSVVCRQAARHAMYTGHAMYVTVHVNNLCLGEIAETSVGFNASAHSLDDPALCTLLLAAPHTPRRMQCTPWGRRPPCSSSAWCRPASTVGGICGSTDVLPPLSALLCGGQEGEGVGESSLGRHFINVSLHPHVLSDRIASSTCLCPGMPANIPVPVRLLHA